MGTPTPPYEPLRERAAGSVLTAFEGSTAVMFLFGEIDATTDISLGFDNPLAPQTGRPERVERVVVDVRRMTFCDVTLVNFLAAIAPVLPVTLRYPNELLLDLLDIAGLIGLVKVEDPVTGGATVTPSGPSDLG